MFWKLCRRDVSEEHSVIALGILTNYVMKSNVGIWANRKFLVDFGDPSAHLQIGMSFLKTSQAVQNSLDGIESSRRLSCSTLIMVMFPIIVQWGPLNEIMNNVFDQITKSVEAVLAGLIFQSWPHWMEKKFWIMLSFSYCNQKYLGLKQRPQTRGPPTVSQK